ncbi:hypothetical protein CSOJ01_00402 [Colletotrichum sojae]|uniref:Uncharacterized protein n=1 Tax=Colletotrichum sojae TaxID=2175907 RepID=A0A8H6N5C1_9PEZI|nr:hypothetical protein CSOJ01_00402 [Colletotrichum sojae]
MEFNIKLEADSLVGSGLRAVPSTTILAHGPRSSGASDRIIDSAETLSSIRLVSVFHSCDRGGAKMPLPQQLSDPEVSFLEKTFVSRKQL